MFNPDDKTIFLISFGKAILGHEAIFPLQTETSPTCKGTVAWAFSGKIGP